jgi:quercetin dioxygenase-like cupin family protein
MNIKDSLSQEKAVSTAVLFKSALTNTTAIQILQGEQLKEHTTKVPALLICVIGKVIFENEKGTKETLSVSDYVKTGPSVKHWVNAL